MGKPLDPIPINQETGYMLNQEFQKKIIVRRISLLSPDLITQRHLPLYMHIFFKNKRYIPYLIIHKVHISVSLDQLIAIQKETQIYALNFNKKNFVILSISVCYQINQDSTLHWQLIIPPPIFCIHCVQGVTNDYRYHEMYTLTVICELIFPGPCFCVNISINLNLQTTYFLVMFTRSFGFVVAVSVSFGFIGPSV